MHFVFALEQTSLGSQASRFNPREKWVNVLLLEGENCSNESFGRSIVECPLIDRGKGKEEKRTEVEGGGQEWNSFFRDLFTNNVHVCV